MTEPPIPMLDPMEHIRLRPGMYLGYSPDVRALHEMVYKIIHNAAQDASRGTCTRIDITLMDRNGICIRDNGPGLPVEMDSERGVSMLQLLMTRAWHRNFVSGEYAVYGVIGNYFVAPALSTEFMVEVARDSFLWRQSYQKGVPQSPVEQVRPLAEGESTGTTMIFTPDFTIFERCEFDYDTLANRCKELAFLVAGLTVTLRDERQNAGRE